MDFESTIRQLAKDNPSLTVLMAVHIADKTANDLTAPVPVPPPGAPLEANALYAFEHEEIMELVLGQKKINAIKLMRELTHIGLKEAKDAVELAQSWEDKGKMHRRDIAVTEAQVDETIASITQSFTALRDGAAANGIKL